MKLKLIGMLFPVIGLAFVAVPLGVQALPTIHNQILQAQNFPPSPGAAQPPNLNLSDDQKQRLEEINKETKEKIDAVLTSEQRQTLEEKGAQIRNSKGGMQGRSGVPMPPPGEGNDPFAELNLSNDQKQKIQEIAQSSEEKVKSVFTDEQRQQLEQLRQNMPKRSSS